MIKKAAALTVMVSGVLLMFSQALPLPSSGGTVTASAGITLTGSNLTCDTASATSTGCVTADTQTFAGSKTFNGVVTLDAGAGLVFNGGLADVVATISSTAPAGNLYLTSSTNSTTATSVVGAIHAKCLGALSAGDLCFVQEDNGGNDLFSVEAVGRFSVFGAYLIGTRLIISGTAPTISSGFGTSPTISTTGSTAGFRVNVGTGGVATSGVLGLPTATAGWNCYATDMTNNIATRMTSSTTTTATLTAASAWTASDILAVSCFAY